MSFKKRLILSYVIMFIAPIILTLVAASIIVYLNFRAVAGSYGFDFKGNPMQEFAAQSQTAFNDIKAVAAENPDSLQNKSYIEDLDKRLSKINTGVVIRKNDKIIYTSSSLNKFDLSKGLPQFGEPIKDTFQPTLLGYNMTFVRHEDFYFTDKSQGTVFLITDASPVLKSMRRVALLMGISILLILITTDGVLTYVISKSVLKPIETLTNAANQIKEGNLNFKVQRTSSDEIGELCSTFEEMRQKLKESIDLQIQYENNRKELISNISHDLKTPVTAIKGYVEGIIDGVADSPDKVDRYVKTIYTKASDLDKLIDELFLFSKLDLNKLPFNFEEVSIREYIEECTKELSLDIEGNKISLNLNIELKGDPLVLIDREKLKRVVTNIVENSKKYMDKEEGRIDIILSEDENEIKVEIKDNGQGIPNENLPFVFDRFYRSDISRNSSTGGSGLGLAIVKRIIEEHEGGIWAQSKEGIGTSIFFTLKKIEKQG